MTKDQIINMIWMMDDLTTREFGSLIGVSAMTVSRWTWNGNAGSPHEAATKRVWEWLLSRTAGELQGAVLASQDAKDRAEFWRGMMGIG